MKDICLAWRLLGRDWRAGELGVLVLALVIAVTSMTAIVLVTNRLSRTLVTQAADFLAADLVVGAHAPLPREWFEQARAMRLETGRTVEFATVLVEDERLLLVGVKAVGGTYPLRGKLKTATAYPGRETVAGYPPGPGRVWVGPRVLSDLQLRVGDELQLGRAALTIERVLTYEPDVRGGFYSMSPRVLMRVEDLAATGILGPGSRAHYYLLAAGGEKDVRRFKAWLEPRLETGQKVLDIYDNRPEIGRALTRARRYLGLAGVIVVLIAGVAVAMASRRYTERHFDGVAMLKCLGAGQGRILRLFGSQFLILGVVAGAAGLVLGWGVEEGLVWWMRPVLPKRLAGPEPFSFVAAPLTCLLLLIGFALPPLLRLRRVPPLRVLRREALPLPVGVWLVYGLAMVSVAALVWHFTADMELTLLVLGGGGAALSLMACLILGILWLSRGLLRKAGLVWRLGLWNLIHHRGAALGQILAFAVTLAAMSLGTLVQGDLVESWRRQLPAKAPNYFVINVFPHELGAFRSYLTEDLGAVASAFYPVVRGRLVAVNGVDPHVLAEPGSQGENAINRDLSLTWSDALPKGNRLISGAWWRPESVMPQVSVERKVAESLGIEVGDLLGFSIEGRSVTARVGSIRSVDWDSMTPNFYVIFAPGDLQGFAVTYMTSFYLPAAFKNRLGDLIRRFPNATLIEVETILRHLRTILGQAAFAVEYVLILALLAGVTVLMAAVRNSIDDRIRQGALLRALGAGRRVITVSQWIEFGLLGVFSGILAVWITESLAWLLYVRVFEIEFQPHWRLWWAVPVLGGMLTGIFGWWNTRGVLRKSPAIVLREL